jgi:hypothetical protein
MKLTTEQRQQIYERNVQGIVDNYTKSPMASLVRNYDAGLTEIMIGGRCLTLLKIIHGGTFRLIWHILKHWASGRYWFLRGKLWRLRHKMRGLSDDEIDELVFADDEDTEE